MKKFLLGAVCALTVSSTSFGQIYGNDKGNGGDAVMINNELVMRDFVSRSHLTPIPDTMAFVKSVPDLQALIVEISKVNNNFALTIISELVNANFYNSSASLDILPSSTTAIGGPRAVVQLAVRWGDDIVLAPEFKNFQEKSYLLVHEALHGVNNGAGALHHERVRLVVNYLKTNRGHYTSEGLLEVLKYTNLGDADDFNSQVALDKTVPVVLRCQAISNSFGELVRDYINLECPEWNFHAVRDYIKSEIDFSYLGGKKDYFHSFATYYSRKIEMVAPISLPQTRFFERKEIVDQKYKCYSNNADIRYTMDYENEPKLALRVQADVAKLFKRTDISANTKKIVLNYFEGKYAERTLAEAAKNAQVDLAKYAKNKATRLANNKRCIAKFGKEVFQ